MPCCGRLVRRIVHISFAFVLVVAVSGYVASRYSGDCDMKCREGTSGAVDNGDGTFQCGDKTSCSDAQRTGIYACAAAICVVVILWAVWTAKACMISRKERREAAEYSAEQAMAMKQGPEGHLIAGGESAV